MRTAGRPIAIVARAPDAVRDAEPLAKENALTNATLGPAAPATARKDLAARCYLLAPTRDSQGRRPPGWNRTGSTWRSGSFRRPPRRAARRRGRLARALKAAARRTGTAWRCCVRCRAGPPSFFKAKAPEAAVARSRAAADVRASLRALGRARSDRAKVDGIAALVRMTRGHEAKWLVKTLPPAMQGVGISLEATVLPCSAGRSRALQGPRVCEDRPAAGREERSVRRTRAGRC